VSGDRKRLLDERCEWRDGDLILPIDKGPGKGEGSINVTSLNRRTAALESQLAGAVDAFDRIVVACDNGSEPENKLTFIRRVANDARAALRGQS
jgi:hypothetical protein